MKTKAKTKDEQIKEQESSTALIVHDCAWLQLDLLHYEPLKPPLLPLSLAFGTVSSPGKARLSNHLQY